MELRPGYKRSDIGVVPEAWRVEPLASLADKIMVGIASAATHAYRSNGVPLFRNQDVKAGRLDDSNLLFIDPDYEATYKNKRLHAGDLVTMRTGYPGVTAIVPPQFEGSQCFTSLITRPNRKLISSDYLCRYLNSEFGRRFFALAQTGGAQKNVNAGTLRLMPIPVPEPREQHAIAEALGDTDRLIDSLERLIAKKRDINQGVIQQLLSGKTRLPGFNKEWTECELGAIGFTYGGLSGKSSKDFGFGASYIPFMNVMANTVIDCSSFALVHVAPGEKQNRVLKGDLLLNGSSETPEEVAMCAVLDQSVEELYLNSFCFGFRIRDVEEFLPHFLTMLLRSPVGRSVIKSLAQGSTRYNLSKKELLKARIRVPEKVEQHAIVSAITDFDAELAALEQRLAKTRDLKQGMMQELLTGRTRLIKPEVAHSRTSHHGHLPESRI
jgi:type I restriction enzyme S subunit